MSGFAVRAETGDNMEEFIVLSIPFLGTTLGAAMVFFMRAKMNPQLEKLLLGFAAGVMIAASVWSLLIPAIELEEKKGNNAWLPAAAGDWVFAFAGYPDTASSCGRGETGRHEIGF